MPGVCALLLLEGETEEEFYAKFLETFAPRSRRKIKNLHGNYNINKKIVEAAYRFYDANPKQLFAVFVCVDQERLGVPAFDYQFVTKTLASIPTCKKIVPVVTILTIESIFFLDIDGIYTHLKAPIKQRTERRFSNFRALNHISLAKLYKQFGKIYCKGRRCAGLVQHLDMKKICSAVELEKLKNELQGLDKASRVQSRSK